MGEPINPNLSLDTTRLHRWLSYVAPSALRPVCSRRAVGPGYHMSRLRRCGPCVRAVRLAPGYHMSRLRRWGPCVRAVRLALAIICRAFGAAARVFAPVRLAPGYHMSRLRRCGPCVRAARLAPSYHISRLRRWS